jgi:hypothetical protein
LGVRERGFLRFLLGKLLRQIARFHLLTYLFSYAGIVKHFREAHPQRYWTTNDWIVAG